MVDGHGAEPIRGMSEQPVQANEFAKIHWIPKPCLVKKDRVTG
jgi:hypothetical protein